MTKLETKPMNLTEAVKIFESFDNWARSNEAEFTEYTPDQVLEAQGIVLNEAKQNLAFEMSAISLKDAINKHLETL